MSKKHFKTTNSQKYRSFIKEIVADEVKNYLKEDEASKKEKQKEDEPEEPKTTDDEEEDSPESADTDKAPSEASPESESPPEADGAKKPSKAQKIASSDVMQSLLGLNRERSWQSTHGERLRSMAMQYLGMSPRQKDALDPEARQVLDKVSDKIDDSSSPNPKTPSTADTEKKRTKTPKQTPKQTLRAAVLKAFDWVEIDKMSTRTKKDLMYQDISDVHIDDIMNMESKDRLKIFKKLLPAATSDENKWQKMERLYLFPRIFYDAPAEVIGAVLASFDKSTISDISDAFLDYHRRLTSVGPGKAAFHQKELDNNPKWVKRYKQVMFNHFKSKPKKTSSDDPFAGRDFGDDPFAGNPFATD